jgi:lipoic acid synthetase/lipoate-protein ligase A
MLYIGLPEASTNRKLSFYLAMEEYVARHLDADDSFFMWQVAPSVIFGRNQQLDNEVNMDYCRRHHIQVFRRKSGGGCVYADQSNVMLSYITKEENVGFAFNRFVNMLLLVFRRLGIEAVGTSRNDVLIADRKVCGTACYHLPGRTIIHSTLLYDTDMDYMTNAITPGPDKLQAKGIQSVRQRITLLKDHVSQSLDDVKQLIRNTFCEESCQLSADDVAAIERLEQAYERDGFIYSLS